MWRPSIICFNEIPPTVTDVVAENSHTYLRTCTHIHICTHTRYDTHTHTYTHYNARDLRYISFFTVVKVNGLLCSVFSCVLNAYYYTFILRNLYTPENLFVWYCIICLTLLTTTSVGLFRLTWNCIFKYSYYT